ncbi:MAG: iron-sulfur cluster assembly scaffold protein [candidate division Zixibacteria bacterium]|nr:iron-sulfur cluster assembly scaffold protein [Candidatus Tariuqbacter arcticus]
MYSEKYLKHFQNPQNIGDVLEPDGAADVKHEGGGCLDRVRMTMKVEDDIVVDIRYKLRACSGTIAASSAVTSLANGKSVSEADDIQIADVLQELGGVPEKKMHSVELAVKALNEAIADYRRRAAE